MTQEQKIIRAKVGLLELAKQLGNVSQACKTPSNAACGFPALRSPICFTSRFMGPILPGRLSACRVALDSR
jgi:hypothetical protein